MSTSCISCLFFTIPILTFDFRSVPAKYGIVDGLIYYANVDQLGIPTVHSLVPSVGQVGLIVGLFVTV